MKLTNRCLADIAVKEKVQWKLTSDSHLERLMSGQVPEGGATIEQRKGISEIIVWMTQELSTPNE